MSAVSPARSVRLLERVPPVGAFLPGIAALLMLFSMPATAQTPAEGVSPPPSGVVTNKQLEPFRLRREAQEEEYERTRWARGLPSREELRRQAEERDRRLFEWARHVEAGRREAEMAALWSELLATRLRLDTGPPPSRAGEVYEVSYPSPVFHPYFYAPPVRFGRFGHRGFGLRLRGRGWLHGARMNSLFRYTPFGLRPHTGTLPRVRPPAASPRPR